MTGTVRARRTLVGTAFLAKNLNRRCRTRLQKFSTSTLVMMGTWLGSELSRAHIPPSFAVYDRAAATSTCSFQLLVVTVWTKRTKAFMTNTWCVVFRCGPRSVATPLPARLDHVHEQLPVQSVTCGVPRLLVAHAGVEAAGEGQALDWCSCCQHRLLAWHWRCGRAVTERDQGQPCLCLHNVHACTIVSLRPRLQLLRRCSTLWLWGAGIGTTSMYI
jgi:hypothetical protein